MKCIICDRDLSQKIPTCVCDDCNKKLPLVNEKICIKCGEPIPNQEYLCKSCKLNRFTFNVARQNFYYEKPISTLIKKLKYTMQNIWQNHLLSFLTKII